MKPSSSTGSRWTVRWKGLARKIGASIVRPVGSGLASIWNCIKVACFGGAAVVSFGALVFGVLQDRPAHAIIAKIMLMRPVRLFIFLERLTNQPRQSKANEIWEDKATKCRSAVAANVISNEKRHRPRPPKSPRRLQAEKPEFLKRPSFHGGGRFHFEHGPWCGAG